MIEAVVGVALRAILASVLLGGVLAALVLVATRAFALTAATRHALWTTALVATALMPLAGIGVSVARATIAVSGTHVSSDPGSSSAAHVSRTRANALGETAAPAQQGHVPASTATTTTTTTAPAVARVSTPVASLADRFALADRLAFAAWTPRVSRAAALGVAGVWALGALLGLIGLAGSVVRVRGLKRRSSPLDGTLADELPWLIEVKPGREIYLRLSYETETPVAIGFRRPVILIPTELATADGLGAIEPLILHEHAHLRRNDDWTNLLQRAIERVFWFNPLVWFIGRRIALEREIASDDAVVEKTGEPHAYATSLWKLAREMRMPEHAAVAPGALLTRKQIAVRIEQLLDKKRARLHRSPAAALGVALAGVLSIAFVATSAPGVELPAEAAAETASNLSSASSTSAASNASTASAAAASELQHAHAHAAYRAAAGNGRAAQQASSAAVTAVRTADVNHASHGTAGSNDAQSKALRAQLRALRDQLAAAKKTTTVTHENTIRIVERAPQDPAPAASREMSQAWHEIPSEPAAAPPLAPMPAVAPRAPAMPPQTLIKVQTSAAARAARERDLSHVNYEQIERTIAAAMATIPHAIALEINVGNARHARLDGVKLSRKMVASCVACSFRNADARGLDLHDLKLNGDNFTGADMRGVNLSDAKLAGVLLASANLANADLRGAQLTGVDLHGTNLDGAQLEGVRLSGVSIRRTSVHGTTLRNLVANCTGCELSGLDLHGQDLHGLTLTGTNLSDADLHDADLSGVHFVHVDLSNANLSGADLSNAHFETCDFDGADLRGARTTGMTTHPGGPDA